MATQSSMHIFFDWAKGRLDEIDATLAFAGLFWQIDEGASPGGPRNVGSVKRGARQPVDGV
jgi:hypothetical protein